MPNRTARPHLGPVWAAGPGALMTACMSTQVL